MIDNNAIMTDRHQTIAFWRGRLPHWEVADGLYFVTIHLAGAIPPEACDKIQATARRLEESDRNTYREIQRRIFQEMEAWLDRAETVSHLQNPDIARMVMESIAFREEQKNWRLFEYVIMPSHIHMYLQMTRGRLKSEMEKFKRRTGHEAAKLMELNAGRFWQREWFDHWSRSAEEGEKIRTYIQQNPVKARLVSKHTDWPYGSWNKK